jgi:hypothetical protein
MAFELRHLRNLVVVAEELLFWARCELSIDVTAPLSVSMQQVVEAVGAPGKTSGSKRQKAVQVLERDLEKQ